MKENISGWEDWFEDEWGSRTLCILEKKKHFILTKKKLFPTMGPAASS